MTGFTPLSDVFISRELNEKTTIAELAAILLYVMGHHLGIHDENEHIDELNFKNRTLKLK